MSWVMACGAIRKNYSPCWTSYQNTYSCLLWDDSCSLTGWDMPLPAGMRPPVSKALPRWSLGNGLPPLWSLRCKEVTWYFFSSYLGLVLRTFYDIQKEATWQNLSQKRIFQILILLRIPTLSSSAPFHTRVLSNFYWPIFGLWITCKSLWN